MRVLIVEDNVLLARVLTEALTEAGHEVIGPASSSGEAIQLAENEDPQIALVDLDLERWSIGLDVAEELTAELDIDVIICTATPELARRGSSGAIGLISKPYDLRDVVKSLSIVQAFPSENQPSPLLPPSFELLVSPQ